MNIKGKKVTLRQMSLADMEMICDMFNDPELEDLVVGLFLCHWNSKRSGMKII